MKFKESHIRDFSKILRYNLFLYLDDYYLFIQNNYNNIVNYYKGQVESLDNETIELYEKIYIDSYKLADRIRLKSSLFTEFIHFEIIDYLEDLRSKLLLLPNLFKFFRSSKTNFNFNGKFEFNHITAKNDTLEKVSSYIIEDSDYQNSWQEIALQNNLFEIDYNNSSNIELKLRVDLESSNTKVESILDNATGLRILGKDIDKNFVYEDDDLKILGYQDTLKQSIDILTNLLKNSIPEFLEFGRNSIVGSNVKSFGLTSVIRQMVNVFASDDSLTNFEIKQAVVSGSDVIVEFTIRSRANTIVNNRLSI